MGLQYPEMSHKMLADKPELLWRILIEERAPCEEILKIIKQSSNKASQIEALSHLWLLARHCKESESILSEIDQCRLIASGVNAISSLWYVCVSKLFFGDSSSVDHLSSNK